MNDSSPFSGIEHIAIGARSPEALADFYVQVLGFHIVTTFDNGPKAPKTYMVGLGGGPMLEIVPADRATLARERQNTDPGPVHLAITVSDFDLAVSRLARTTARIEGQERAGPLNSRVQFYRDPEGNLFHLLYRPQPLPGRKAAGG